MYRKVRSNADAAFAVVLACIALTSCNDHVVEVVTPYALAGPKRLASGAPLKVEFYFSGGTWGHVDSYSFESVNDSLLNLVVKYSNPTGSRCSGCGIPSSFWMVGIATLANPPHRPFRMVMGDLALQIEGGALPLSSNRLKIQLVNRFGQGIPGIPGEFVDGSHNFSGSGSLLLPPTDSTGTVVLMDECESPGESYYVTMWSDEAGYAEAQATHPPDCTTPQQMVLFWRYWQ